MMISTNENPVPGSGNNNPTGSDMRQTLKEDLSGAVDTVKEQAGVHLDQYKDTAADRLENLAHTAQKAAQTMDEGDSLGLSRYVGDVAEQMTGFAENLRSKNAEQLLHDAGRLARDNPLLFLAGSVALGLALSRLLKASPTSVPRPRHASSVADLTPDTNIHAPHDSISPATLAAEEMVATHPRDNDVLHSARPGTGIPDRKPGTFSGSEHRTGDLDDGLPGSSSHSSGPRGGV